MRRTIGLAQDPVVLVELQKNRGQQLSYRPKTKRLLLKIAGV